MNFNLDIFLDYTRLVAYALISLGALKGIGKRKFTNLLFVGDLVMIFALVLTNVYVHILGVEGGIWDEVFLTTGAVIWAIIHFISILREDK